MKILVTGGSGLLGTCLLESLADLGEVVGTCHSNPRAGLIPLDITDPAAVQAAIEGYTHVVHCAANRDPDSCLRDPVAAYQVNTIAVEYIAAACLEAGARLIHISTDYVFDGTNPPYREDATPNPVNLYGRTKLGAEMAARRVPGVLIIRIPALYTLNLTDQGNVLTRFVKMLEAGKTTPQDAHTIRYYTRADDVARGVAFAIEKGLTGALHLSADQRTTKADFVQRIARVLGYDPALVPDGPPPTSGDVRPDNSRMGNEKYKNLGGPAFADIDSSLQTLRK